MFLSTEEFAKCFGIKPQTVLKRKCETGTYFGYAPRKHPNGRLAWPKPNEQPTPVNTRELSGEGCALDVEDCQTEKSNECSTNV